VSKQIKWCGSSKKDISAFPDDAREDAGHQLYLVQEGEEPRRWRSMSTVGPGVREIKVDGADGTYRVFYVASFESAIYVLHAFQKTTEQTAQSDIELGRKRYKQAKAEEAEYERKRKKH
jgi:phage-related protein